MTRSWSHEVLPLARATAWILDRAEEGTEVDVRWYAGRDEVASATLSNAAEIDPSLCEEIARTTPTVTRIVVTADSRTHICEISRDAQKEEG